MTHVAASTLAALAAALTLVVSAADAAPKTRPSEASCFDKYIECQTRCRKRAEAKYGEVSNKNPNVDKLNAAMASCDKRTCIPQLRNCEKNEKKQSIRDLDGIEGLPDMQVQPE